MSNIQELTPFWKKCESLYIPDPYIYRPGTYRDSHLFKICWKSVRSEKVWVLVCSCNSCHLVRNIQEPTPFQDSLKTELPVQVWVLVCSMSVYIKTRNIQDLTPFQKTMKIFWKHTRTHTFSILKRKSNFFQTFSKLGLFFNKTDHLATWSR